MNLKRINKSYLIVGGVVLVGLIAGIIFSFRAEKKEQELVEREQREKIESEIPKSKFLTINEVELENFYNNKKTDINARGDALIKDTGDAHIIFFNETESFLISILESPFEVKRREAEQEFLETMSLTEEEACKLNVEITTPLFANPDEAGKIFRLSFCK